MQQAEKNFYPSLTGIRAIAAWMVFIHHTNPFAERIFGKSIHNFFAEMHIGVTVFFVLSGLLITLRYYDLSINTREAFYRYMVKRFARIFPVFILILSLNFIWYASMNIDTGDFFSTPVHYIVAATLLRGFFAFPANVPLPQSWSLTVEECFYLACPVIFFFARKKIRSLVITPLLLIAIGIFLCIVFSQYPFHDLFDDLGFLFNFTFFGRCIEFFAGIGTALLYKKYVPPLKKSIVYTSIGIGVIFICLSGLSLLHTDLHYGDYYAKGIIINNLILPVFGISLLFWGLLTEKNFITGLLSSRTMVLLGKSSYIFYLIHVGVFTAIFYPAISTNIIFLFIYLNVLSILLYKGFEHPVNKWLRRKLLREKPSPISGT